MPDWSYQTVFRPALFRLPPPLARDLSLGFLGGLARLPLGTTVINLLGHMRPDIRLQTQVAGLPMPGPAVLGPLLDSKMLATGALGQFGFGMLEIGPACALMTAPGRLATTIANIRFSCPVRFPPFRPPRRFVGFLLIFMYLFSFA